MEKGFQITTCPWNGEFTPFENADLIILRSNWDYHYDLDGFVRWLDRLLQSNLAVRNKVAMVKRNIIKDYLLDLEKSGVPVPKTRIWKSGESLQEVFEEQNWRQAVLKPQTGASGHLVEKITLSQIDEWVDTVANRTPGRKWLVQEFLPEVQTTGEISLVFFNGIFSHAIRKLPQKGEFRVNSQYRGKLKRVFPGNDLIHQAENALKTLEEAPLYARVDGVIRDESRFIVCELELNEPALYFDLAPEQALTFCKAIVDLV